MHYAVGNSYAAQLPHLVVTVASVPAMHVCIMMQSKCACVGCARDREGRPTGHGARSFVLRVTVILYSMHQTQRTQGKHIPFV